MTYCKEYIERNAILELYQLDDPVLNKNGHVPLPVIRQNIMDIPAADVAPVRHGRWDWMTLDVYRCRNCGEEVHVKEVMGQPDYHYCPNCGARMDL